VCARTELKKGGNPTKIRKRKKKRKAKEK